ALGIEALRVSALAHIERGAHEDLDELLRPDEVAHGGALGAERRDERAEHEEARVDEQLRHLAHAADVLDPVGGGEAEVLVEPMAHVIAVQQVGMGAALGELPLHEVRDRRLAGPGKAGEPEDARSLPLSAARRILLTASGRKWTLTARRSAEAAVAGAVRAREERA